MSAAAVNADAAEQIQTWLKVKAAFDDLLRAAILADESSWHTTAHSPGGKIWSTTTRTVDGAATS